MFVSNNFFNNKVYFIPWFRVHLKHCSSDHNTSRDFEFDKNVPRLASTGAINLKKTQSVGNTLLCYEYIFYINTQAQMLKPFNGLLIQTFPVSAQGTSCQKFFPAHCTCVNFLGDDGLVQELFPCAYSLAGYFFFQNHPPTPQSKMVSPLWEVLPLAWKLFCFSLTRRWCRLLNLEFFATWSRTSFWRWMNASPFPFALSMFRNWKW